MYKESTQLLIHRTCCFGKMTILLQCFFIKMVLAWSILTLIVESKNISWVYIFFFLKCSYIIFVIIFAHYFDLCLCYFQVLESYDRAYSNMVRVQQLSELEEVRMDPNTSSYIFVRIITRCNCEWMNLLLTIEYYMIVTYCIRADLLRSLNWETFLFRIP